MASKQQVKAKSPKAGGFSPRRTTMHYRALHGGDANGGKRRRGEKLTHTQAQQRFGRFVIILVVVAIAVALAKVVIERMG